MAISQEIVARNLAEERGAGRVPGGKDEGALNTALRRVFPERYVRAWRTQNLLQVGL